MRDDSMSLLFASAMASVWSSEISIWVATPVRGGKRNGRTGGTSVLGRGDDIVAGGKGGDGAGACWATANERLHAKEMIILIKRVPLPRNAWAEAPLPSRRPLRVSFRVCARICGTSVTASYRQRGSKIPARRARSATDTASARLPPARRWSGCWLILRRWKAPAEACPPPARWWSSGWDAAGRD